MSALLNLNHDEAAEIAEYLIGRDCDLGEAVAHHYGTSCSLTRESHALLHQEVFRCLSCQAWCSTEDDTSDVPDLCMECNE